MKNQIFPAQYVVKTEDRKIYLCYKHIFREPDDSKIERLPSGNSMQCSECLSDSYVN